MGSLRRGCPVASASWTSARLGLRLTMALVARAGNDLRLSFPIYSPTTEFNLRMPSPDDDSAGRIGRVHCLWPGTG